MTDQCRVCISYCPDDKSCKVYDDLPGHGSRVGTVECLSFIDFSKSEDLNMLTKFIDEDKDQAAMEAVDKLVSKILDGYQDKFKIMVVGIARRKIKSMIRMADIIDLLLVRLSDLNTNMLEDLSSSQVIRLLSELNNSVNNDLSFIMKLLEPDSQLRDLQVFIDQRSVNVNGASPGTEVKAEEILKMTGTSRDRIREAFDALLNNLPTDEPQIVIDHEVADEEGE